MNPALTPSVLFHRRVLRLEGPNPLSGERYDATPDHFRAALLELQCSIVEGAPESLYPTARATGSCGALRPGIQPSRYDSTERTKRRLGALER